MADTIIAAQIKVDATGAVNSVRNFKQELSLAQQEVVNMTEKFGATSKEAAAAAKKAAELKDAVGDAKSLVDAFNPDTKFRAFGASINTVVGGFTALQGVMGLVGVESEDLQKSLLKVQSALAISQGVAQVQEGVQAFKNLGAVIQSTTLFQKANNVVTAIATAIMRAFGASTTATATSMGILKGAIIATGIGALVVLLGVAADAMGLFADKTDDAAEAQQRLKDAVALANAELEGTVNALANEEKLEIARAKRRGAGEEELFQISQKYRRLNFEATKRAYQEITDKDSEQAKKLLDQLNSFNIAGQVAQIDHETKMGEIRKAAAEKALEEDRKRRQQALREAEDELNRQASNFAATGGPGGGLNIAIPKTQAQLQLEQEAQARRDLRLEKEAYDQYTLETDAKFTEIHNRNVEERMAADKAEFEAKEAFANAGISILSSLSELFGRQTAAGKVLAIAEIAAGTAKGFINALTIAQQTAIGTGPAAAFAMPVFYATQIAAVLSAAARAKSILGAGGNSASGPSVGVPAPVQVPKPEQATTTLDQNSLNAIGNATTRAFVLESDVTNNQERVRRLNRAARLGG